MLKEVLMLRKDIRRTWDGSLIKISEKGKPDRYQNTDRYLLSLVDKAICAVREDCAKVAIEQMTIAHDKGLTYEDIANAIRGKK